MRALSFLRNIKWGAVASIALAASAIYSAFANESDLVVALGAASIVFAVLTERDRA